MTTVDARIGPSGPSFEQADDLSPPATVLGLPTDSPADDDAIPLDGAELGQVIRFADVIQLPQSPSYINFPVGNSPDVIDITPSGPAVVDSLIITGGNPGHFVNLRQRGNAGNVSVTTSSAVGTAANTIVSSQTPQSTLSESEILKIFGVPTFFSPTLNSRFNTVTRNVPPEGLTTEANDQPSSCFSILLSGGNGSGSVDTLSTVLRFANVLIYDAMALVQGAAAGGTVVARTAPAGGGIALTSTFSTATTGTRRNEMSTPVVIDPSTPIYLRRVSGGIMNAVIILFCRQVP